MALEDEFSRWKFLTKTPKLKSVGEVLNYVEQDLSL